MAATLRTYKWPSQAFWRYFEVAALGRVPCARPILEIGCGDGRFSGLVFEEIDHAIDINPKSIEKCRVLSAHVYGRITCLDARDLQLQDGGFGTVYANCVLEHVPSLDKVLAGCFRGLRPGGQLVVTVPLVRMNDHLLLRWHWYAKLRQEQLCHINLFSEDEWRSLLESIGFSDVEFFPYLSARACRFWDLMDLPGCIGFGRYRIAAAAGITARKLLPKAVRRWVVERLAVWLSKKAEQEPIEDRVKEPACAALVIATKSAARSQA